MTDSKGDAIAKSPSVLHEQSHDQKASANLSQCGGTAQE